MRESLEQPNSNGIISEKKKKKPKENAKQYKISSFTSEFNMF